MNATDIATTIGTGIVLGWSVAWPPGPINAEMIRRGLTRGFLPAFAVGLGACSGDFIWALFVAMGAGAIVGWHGVRPVLSCVSLVLLLVLAWTFLAGAVKAYRRARSGIHAPPSAGRLDSARGGYVLGISMALSSPWNIAFWLAVIGSQPGRQMPFATSLLLATSVIFAAATWSFVLCMAVRLGARFATPAWEITTQALTGVLMLYFAVHLLIRLIAVHLLIRLMLYFAVHLLIRLAA
jgi:threonine/homoserine/homoserine lactone efflux protein